MHQVEAFEHTAWACPHPLWRQQKTGHEARPGCELLAYRLC